MRRMHRIVLLAGLVALAPILAGCADFDMDKLDVFGLNEKKKLPGDRRPLFPQGVPGVTQGIPPEFIKGNQPSPDTAQTPAGQDNQAPATAPAKNNAAVEPAEEPKPKPKRKPKPRTTASAPAQSQSGGQQQQPAWPAAGQQPAAGQSSSSAPWPSAPAPGTFQR